MHRASFVLSATLAFVGVASAVHGIDGGYPKPIATGLVLLLGAGVFAILSLAPTARRRRGELPDE